MVITRDFGRVVFMCDDCDNFINTDEHDFHEALTVARHEGWLSLKEGSDYTHHCPECVGDSNTDDE